MYNIEEKTVMQNSDVHYLSLIPIKPPIHDQFYCQNLLNIVQSYWSCVGDIDAKILYNTIDINNIDHQ